MTAPNADQPPRLRDDPAALSVLVTRAADSLGIDRAFIEKDFWVTEVLRAVAGGVPLMVGEDEAGHVKTVFKGGTSLSRIYGLIDRFSEDVDLLVVFPAGGGSGSRDKALKALVDAVQAHLNLPDDACERKESTTGVKRNYRFHYERLYPSEAAEDGVLLEMGSRGGTHPHHPHELRSMVAEYAQGTLGETDNTWEEWAPVTVEVLAPERTLIEKLAILHDLSSRAAAGDNDARTKMGRAGRHLYDVHQLLRSDPVRQALTDLGSDGVAKLAADVDSHSAAARWPYTPRPADGYAASPAFDGLGITAPDLRAAYDVAMGLVYGTRPAFDDCIAAVREHVSLL